MRIPELLAPAGSPPMLHAAITAGADAAYLGMGRFNARRNADNFTPETFREACSYAHLRGRRIYVAMNTIVLPDEMGDALDVAARCVEDGADAFIVQDIGLALGISRMAPEVRIHASTQMSIHSEDGVEACAQLGFKRVTLARELSIGEIENLCAVASRLGMEIEVFAHGALCVCYSGQCLMSSMIGGRSANRGLCAQACRLPYRLVDMRDPARELRSPGEFLLSPKDLCSIDLVGELSQAGVSSLKIEGRMKSPEYVHTVVSVYRDALDELNRSACASAYTDSDAGFPEGTDPDAGLRRERSLLHSSSCNDVTPFSGGRPFDREDARSRLGSVFSRGFTTAYLEGRRGGDIMSYQRPNNRGQLVGRVKSVGADSIVMTVDKPLSAGDLLEIWTGRGNVRVETTEAVEKSRKGARIPVGNPAGIRASDRVFRIRSADASFADDDKEPRIPVRGHARLRIGEPLRVGFETLDGSHSAFAEGSVVEPARTKAVTAGDVEAHVDRLGQTPFSLAAFEAEVDDGAGIGFSQIHHARAEALERLEDFIVRSATPNGGSDDVRCPTAASPCENRGDSLMPRFSWAAEADLEAQSGPSARICVVAANPECARAAKRNGADAVYIPALNYKRGQSQTEGVLGGKPSQAGFPKRSVIMIPAISHDPCGDSREAKIEADAWANVSEGQAVYVESLGAVHRAVREGCSFEIGPSLPVTNGQSVAVADALGASCIWLSPELNLRQVGELAQSVRSANSGTRVGVKVAGAQELMVTEHCMLTSQGACSEDCASCSRRKVPFALEDRKGYAFPVVSDAMGRSHLYNSVELDNVPAVPELVEAGVTDFMVDATLMSPERTAQAVGRLAKALEAAYGGDAPAKLPNTTSGRLFRGVK